MMGHMQEVKAWGRGPQPLRWDGTVHLDAGIGGTSQVEDAQLLPVPSSKGDTRSRSQYSI